MNGEERKYIVAVDLDGTLLRGNSWQYFSRMLLRTALRRRPLSGLWLGVLALLRKCCLITHKSVKYRYMLASRILTPDERKDFARLMSALFNPDVTEILSHERQNGALILLATAAAGEYGALIAREAGIEDVIMTPEARRGVPYVQAAGTRKAEMTAQFAEEKGLPVRLIITDIKPGAADAADAPLIRRFPKARVILIEEGRLKAGSETAAV